MQAIRGRFIIWTALPLASAATPQVELTWRANCVANSMATDAIEADVHDVLEPYHVRYEVHPDYIVLDRRPVGAPPVEQRVPAGFNVDLYGILKKEQFPLYHSEGARKVVD